MKRKLPRLRLRTMLVVSACLTLAALGMMTWSVLEPTPLPVMLAMSMGQVLGTSAFALYGWAVLIDLLRKRRAARDSLLPPMGPTPPAAAAPAPDAAAPPGTDAPR